MKHYLQTRNNGYDPFDVFDDFFKPMFFDETQELKTDIRENEKEYELDLALPGYGKEDIKVSLDGGYLTVSANRESKEENGKYLRREISRSVSRSYYVGSDVTREDIKAKFDGGILSLTVPKAQPKQVSDNNYISIE